MTHRKHDRNASADRLGAVESRLLAHPQVVGAVCILPAYDGGAVEQHRQALAAGQACGYARVVVANVDGGLGASGFGGGGRVGERRWLVRAFDHDCVCFMVVVVLCCCVVRWGGE